MHIIDGKTLAKQIREELKEKISKLGATPGLGIILVGNDPASHLYVRLKEKACEEAGIHFEKKLFPESATEKEINLTIQQFNNRDDINGILVQLPLPPNFNADKIIAAIDPKKDADGFHPQNLKAIKNGRAEIIPGTALGIMKLIESTGEKLKGKKAILLVNSKTFALPLQYLLEKEGVKIKVVLQSPSSKLQALNAYNIIVIALGYPNFLKADMVKDGAIIIDVGTTKVNGKLYGDADFESFLDRHVWITPVPGGVGPMTVAMLLENTCWLAVKSARSGKFHKRRRRQKRP